MMKVKICPNNIVLFFNEDGTRCAEHPNGFFHEKDRKFYQDNYEIIN